MKQVLVMAKIGRPIKFLIRLTPEERTRLEGMIHCGIGALNSALKARILLKTDVSETDRVGRMSELPRHWRPVFQRFSAPVASLSKKGWMPHCHARRVPGLHLGPLMERQRQN